MTLLSGSEASAYWDDRHERESDLRSGGHMAFDEATNRMFYMRRLALLMDLIGLQSSPVAPLFLLDAGCGKGWFSRELVRFGHRVDAIDGSLTALQHAEAEGGGPRFHRSSLSGWRNPWLYDVVFSIDVLFHILDEDEWERSVRNLASLVRLGGRLVLSDWDAGHDQAFGNYQVLRGPGRYRPLLEGLGLRYDGWQPYDFRASVIGFHAFTRVG
ncbi:type 11 methyltransferase [Actinoplanes sp. SE50]|uniref:class I SAM-dependent methyltransferase n=1 Tax=unclassified Actinoplanes TaxID=2626549 RepID=UPI00023EDD86|nr:MULTISPECIES: class I SAM-dependent methyltransferase [unclassified Actinoplanes]AEV88624.1 methyltransferase type 11 [Actinoplanes sp. SE50/110]ATO87028.1 type 11 methyltransferase [Actinoplanes sp. SE50]SLM04446.1 type 11 methyltransferase [Actinoplanes sp. SE50/110]